MENRKSSDHGSRPLCGESDIETPDCCSCNSFLDKPISPTRPRLLVCERQPSAYGTTNNAVYVGRTLLRRPRNNSSTADDQEKKPLPTEIAIPLAYASGVAVSCLSLPSTCSLETQNHENEDFFGKSSSSALQRMSVKARRISRATPFSVRLTDRRIIFDPSHQLTNLHHRFSNVIRTQTNRIGAVQVRQRLSSHQ